MRKIVLNPPTTSIWKRWLTACDKATADLCTRVARGEKPVIKSTYKWPSIKKSFFLSKGPPFYGKCAYCEAPIADYQPGDMEHFRPTAGVTDEDDQPIVLRDEAGDELCDARGSPIHHPG